MQFYHDLQIAFIDNFMFMLMIFIFLNYWKRKKTQDFKIKSECISFFLTHSYQKPRCAPYELMKMCIEVVIKAFLLVYHILNSRLLLYSWNILNIF